MNMITDHNATVLPFADALLRAPRKASVAPEPRRTPDAELPDNVIVLARFSRRANRAQRRFWLAGPPDGEAA
jgi:hypothetical protein